MGRKNTFDHHSLKRKASWFKQPSLWASLERYLSLAVPGWHSRHKYTTTWLRSKCFTASSTCPSSKRTNQCPPRFSTKSSPSSSSRCSRCRPSLRSPSPRPSINNNTRWCRPTPCCRPPSSSSRPPLLLPSRWRPSSSSRRLPSTWRWWTRSGVLLRRQVMCWTVKAESCLPRVDSPSLLHLRYYLRINLDIIQDTLRHALF